MTEQEEIEELKAKVEQERKINHVLKAKIERFEEVSALMMDALGKPWFIFHRLDWIESKDLRYDIKHIRSVIENARSANFLRIAFEEALDDALENS